MIPHRSPHRALRAWLALTTLGGCAGWALSLAHLLNPTGYAVVLALLLGGSIAWLARRRSGGDAAPVRPGRGGWPRYWSRAWRRRRRPLPVLYALLAAGAWLGGILYAPCNYDALAYRLPRVLHWLAHGSWYWIADAPGRLNTRAIGVEWLTAPVLALTHSDRLLFAINACSFLLLPGLVFSVFRQLGVRRRVAWHWMWLLPTAYCLVLQAGSIGNDLFAAVFALAALDFALRARRSGAVTDLWWSLLAAALLTSAKTSNLPLLLPWLVAVAPSLPLLRQRRPATAAVVAAAAVVSFLPLAALNWHYCGDWSGAALDGPRLARTSPVKLAGNALNLVLQNFVPPAFPLAGAWNATGYRLLPEQFQAALAANFEGVGARLSLPELQNEEGAGLGFGLAWLGTITVVAGCRHRRRDSANGPAGTSARWLLLVRGSVYVALAAYMLKSGLASSARLIAPYYALLLPALLAGPAVDRVVRTRWWPRLAVSVAALAVAVLVVTPSRPLWPAGRVLAPLAASGHRLATRALTVYRVYAERPAVFAPVIAALPTTPTVIGLASQGDVPHAALWKPYGRHEFVYVDLADAPARLRARGVRWLVVGTDAPREVAGRPFRDWVVERAASLGAGIVAEFELPVRASTAPAPWFVLRLEPALPVGAPQPTN